MKVSVPVAALAALVERERAGRLHIVLRPQPIWLPAEDRAVADRQIDAALAGAGLVDHRGRTVVDFLDMIPLLTSASTEFYGWARTGDETLGILAAGRGLQGVVAVREGDHVAVREANRSRLAEALVEQLPEFPPGGGRERTVREFELAELARHQGKASLPPVVADLVQLLRRPVSGSGELYAGRRDDVGRYARTERPLHYADTDWGRYLNYSTGSGDETEIHVGPAGHTALATTLRHFGEAL